MRPLFFGFSGLSLATYSALEALVIISAQGVPIGPGTDVSVLWVFQLGVLGAAVVLIAKFGMYLRDWKIAIDAAIGMATSLTALEARMTQAENRMNDHDKAYGDLRMLINEQERRLGLAGERNTDRGRGRGA